MNRKEAELIAGKLSATGKMPCPSYGIPAKRCITGAKLRKVPGSTCAKCYAFKGMYPFPNVQRALEGRYQSLKHPQWVEAMVTLILATKNPYFRWHDSGDLQSVKHLANIVAVAIATPGVKHWIPTREYKIVADFTKNGGVIPENLTIRASAHMVDAAAPDYGLPTSTVHSSAPSNPLRILSAVPATSHVCPSRTQGNKCGDCRACWDGKVANVSYPIH